MMNHENVTLSIPCIRTIGNIVTGTDEQTQMVIDAGLILAISANLSHQKKTVRKETCWVLSNITAGNEAQIQQCIDADIIEKLVHIILNDDSMVRSEAIWAISNCTASANPQQFDMLVQKGLIRALGSVLNSNNVRVIAVALEGLENVLKTGQEHFRDPDTGDNRFGIVFETLGYLDVLEELQNHKNHQIYKSALKIIEKYFSDEEEDELIQMINTAQQSKDEQTAAT